MNYLAERGNDMIGAMKKELNLDSDIKCTTVQFHDDSYNSQSDSWIGLKFYVESPDMFSYLPTCGLSIWLGCFFFKDVTPCLGIS
jgi:hypothetical protein